MRLTKEMREKILKNAHHINDSVFGHSQRWFYDRMVELAKAQVSLSAEIETQTEFLERFPLYATPFNQVNIHISEDEDDTIRISLDKSFARKFHDDRFGRCGETPEFEYAFFTGSTREAMIAYCDRKMEDRRVAKEIDGVLRRITTVKQLLSEYPAAGYFFDEDEEFRIPSYQED